MLTTVSADRFRSRGFGKGRAGMKVRDAILVGVGVLAVVLWTLYNYVVAT